MKFMILQPTHGRLKHQMPIARSGLDANVVNGKIYVVAESLTEVYDPVNDSWATKTPPPFAMIQYVSVALDKEIFVISPEKTQIYNTSTDTWRDGKPPLPLSKPYHIAVATTGVNAPKRIYAFGLYENFVKVYDPQNDEWTRGSIPITSRLYFGASVLNDQIYTIGGLTSSSSDLFISTFNRPAINEEFTPIGFGTPDPTYVPPIESTSPYISIFSPTTQYYTTSSFPLKFSADKPLCWSGYSIDGQANVTISGNASISGLVNGLHNVTVYGTDEFGILAFQRLFLFRLPWSLSQPLLLLLLLLCRWRLFSLQSYFT